MRTPSTATNTAIGQTVTTPGYLIYLDVGAGYRYSTRGTVTWDSQTWTAGDVEPSGMAIDVSSPTASASLRFAGSMGWATIARANTIPGSQISIWKFYGDSNPGASDPIMLYDGVGDDVQISDSGEVAITLTQPGGATLYVPRTYMTPGNGFNSLPRDGQLVTFNGEQVRLRPEGI